MSIWNFKEIRKEIKADNLLTLDEGNTPLLEIKAEYGNTLYLKREDKNPTGSWKDRGTAFLLTLLHQNGVKDIVLSSSGNAAISLARYAQMTPNTSVHIVISPSIADKKMQLLNKLQEYKNIHIYTDSHVKKRRSELVATLKAFLWSTAINSDVIKGYWSLGFELAKTIKGNLDKQQYVIASVSSGATFVGIAEGLHHYFQDEYQMPHLVACQTQSCHPLVKSSDESTEPSLADAIIDSTLLRNLQISNIIKNTGGTSIVITNEELESAQEWSLKHNIKDLSYTSLLSVAGFLRLSSTVQNSNFYCIASGR